MKLKLLIGILVFLIIVNAVTIGSFVYMRLTQSKREIVLPVPPAREYGPTTGPGGRQSRFPMMRLHREERIQLMHLLDEFRRETTDLRSLIHELEHESIQLMRQDSVPRAKVESLLEEISATQYEISRQAVDKLIEAKSYLSPEQQAAFYEAILKARPGRPEGRRMLRGHRTGPFKENRGSGRKENR